MTTCSLPQSRRPVRELLVLIAALVLVCHASVAAADIADFSSDGCSLFPDGTITDRAKWCDCCLQHDIAYWRGGTEEERKQADAVLRDCVLGHTGDKTLAETMYLGVRAGGHPVFPNWYRWAYGWNYGRGYKPLTEGERERAMKKLDRYWKSHPEGYCAEKHGTAPKKERGDDK